MQRLRFVIICSIVLLHMHTTTTKIYEINNISEVLDYAKPKSLILFDLDNTLFAPKNSIYASPQWFEWRFAYLQKKGYTKQQIIEIIDSIHYPAQQKATFLPVEPSSDRIVEVLQRKKIPIVALTARGSINLTKKQLYRARINLQATAEHNNICYVFDNFSPPAYYTPGILFSNGNDKGLVLKAFLQRINYKAQEIILIDDRLYNLENVEKVAQKMGIPFIGLRYGYLDPQVNAFEREMDQLTTA